MKRALLYAGLALVGTAAATAVSRRAQHHLSTAREILVEAGYQPEEMTLGLSRNGRRPVLSAVLPCGDNRQVKAVYGAGQWVPVALIEADGSRQALPRSARRVMTSRSTLESRVQAPAGIAD